MTERVTTRICPLCEAGCGLDVSTRGTQVVAIRGNPRDFFSGGYLCPKGVALKELHEDPDRLRTPMVRRDGQLQAASWSEAFAEIARRLPPLIAQNGRDSVALVLGNPAAHKLGLSATLPRLIRALGTRNVFSASTLDQMPRQLAAGLMYGHWLSIPVPDLVRTDLLIVLGANPVVSNGSMWTVPDFRGKVRALRARGGRLVVIDPRRTETAQIADAHHFIRPNADVYLLLGMVHTLFEEDRVRLGAAQGNVEGLDALRAAVAPWPAERVAPRCGLDAETIRGLARDLAGTPRAAIYGRIGTCTQEFGTLASWLIDVLNVLTGHLDAPGGLMWPTAPAFAANTQGAPGKGRGIVVGRRHSRVEGAPEVFGEFPIGCLPGEIETPGEGQVRALVTVASNPVLSAPEGPRLSRALGKLDFMLSFDIYLNETTRHADVILPGLSPLEEAHYDIAFPQMSWRNQARFSEAVVPPPPDHPPEWQTLARLMAILAGEPPDLDVLAWEEARFEDEIRRGHPQDAERILTATRGLSGPWRALDVALRSGPFGDRFGAHPDGLSLAKLRAHPDGIDLGALQPRLPEVLRTPSGKVELAPTLCLADLARVEADAGRPAPDMVVIGRRQVRSTNSWMHNLPVLAKGPFRCTALVHPDDAARLGLRDGGRARLHCGPRSLDVVVECSDEMMPGVLSLPHGWGHDQPDTRLEVASQRPGANLNALLDASLRDPLSGNAVLGGVPVRVETLEAALATT